MNNKIQVAIKWPYPLMWALVVALLNFRAHDRKHLNMRAWTFPFTWIWQGARAIRVGERAEER